MTARQLSVLGPLMGGFGSQAVLGCLHGAGVDVAPAVMVFLADEIVADVDLFRRVWGETQLGTQIDHPHVIAVMGLAQLEEGYARVVEYVDAESLRSVMRRAQTLKRPLPASIACALVADAAFGVHYAHEIGSMEAGEPIIHGGIRPETLQVSFKGVGKVTGYGAAIIAEVARRARPDGGRDVYTAPEQAYGGRAAATVQTDVYALGCVLYEALTGKAPFAADSDLAEAMIRDELARPQHAGVTDAMRAVVLRATRKKSAERYASALELRQALLETCAPAPEGLVASTMSELFPPDAVPRVTRAQMLAVARAAPPPPSGHLLEAMPPQLVRAQGHRPVHLSDTEIEAAQGRPGQPVAPASAHAPQAAEAEGEAAAEIFDVPTLIPELVEEVGPAPAPSTAPLHAVDGPDDEVTDRVPRRVASVPGAASVATGSAGASMVPPPAVVYRTSPAVLVALGVFATLAVVAGVAAVVTAREGASAEREVASAASTAVSREASSAASAHGDTSSPPAAPPPVAAVAATDTRPGGAPTPRTAAVRAGTSVNGARSAATSTPAAPAAPARLEVRATPASMVITVNGVAIGTGAGTWEGKAGQLRVVGRDAALGAQVTQTVRARPGELATVELEARTGTLTFDQLADGLDVFVDGKKVGRTPMAAIELYAGTHKIDVKKGTATVTLRGEVVAGRELYITATFE